MSMIIIKSKQEIELMREAGKVNGYILSELERLIRPGMSTLEIDQFVEKTVKAYGMIASEKGYCGYPASICVSINEEVVHGIPSAKRFLKEGDIVSLDPVSYTHLDVYKRQRQDRQSPQSYAKRKQGHSTGSKHADKACKSHSEGRCRDQTY